MVSRTGRWGRKKKRKERRAVFTLPTAHYALGKVADKNPGQVLAINYPATALSVSAGVCDATGTSDKSQVLNGARQALERAAKDGGNTVVIY